MALSKSKKAQYNKAYYFQKKAEKQRADALGVKGIMSKADARAMRRAGIRPDDVETGVGKVSSRIYYALMRDRDAIKTHMSWHHEQVGKPDIGTQIEKLTAQIEKLTTLVSAFADGKTVESKEIIAEAERIIREG